MFEQYNIHDRDYFPVQFELDSLWVGRAQFTAILSAYEALMGLGFSKTEITNGQYHSDRLMKAWGQYEAHDEVLTSWRGSRLFALVAHVAQKPEDQPQREVMQAPTTTGGQLALF